VLLYGYGLRLTKCVNLRVQCFNHLSGQRLWSGMSPLPNHGQARTAESANHFMHKLKICLKELRESHRWLRPILRVPLLRPRLVDPFAKETDALAPIFVRSIQTTELRKR
jgi:four helix bundle protein